MADVDVAGAVHDAGHSAEQDEEAHVGSVRDAFDGDLSAGGGLVSGADRVAERIVERDFGRTELAAEPFDCWRVVAQPRVASGDGGEAFLGQRLDILDLLARSEAEATLGDE